MHKSLFCLISLINSSKTSTIIAVVLEFRTEVTLGGAVTGRGQVWDWGGGTSNVLFLDLGLATGLRIH